MSLKSVTIPTTTIPVQEGESFTVRGFSFVDITTLYHAHEPTMSALFDRFVGLEEAGKFSAENPEQDMKVVGEALLKDAPELAAAAIALAADEPAEIDKVTRLPFPIQLEALKAIGALTFATEGGLGKVIETVSGLMTGATKMLPSKPGSGQSAGK